MVGMLVWLAVVIWQLRLASTKDKIWSRTGYVTRGQIAFDGCVVFYWFALVWGTGMLIGTIAFAIKRVSN